MVSKKSLITAILISVVATASVICMGLLLFVRFGDAYSVVSAISGNSSSMAKFQTIYNTVLNNHINELDEEKLIDSAIKGMLDATEDKYTYYLSKEEYDASFSSKNPTVTGIGITVNLTKTDDTIVITEILKGSHATEVGIQINDEIVAINGVRCTPENRQTLIDSVPGEEGTTVDLIIKRNGEEIPFTVERRTIRIELATSHIYNGSIGYIRLRSFQAAAKDDFNKALEELLEQNITGLVIDLRGNGGGYKDVAVNLVDKFIPEGTVYTSKNNSGVVTTEKSTGNMIDIPFVVLVNEYSASASELFAGAIQDYGTGLLIGETTFGKGIVQHTRMFNDGSYFQFTAEEWLTPNGRQIHGIGLTPDVVVEMEQSVTDYISANPTLIPSVEYDKQLEEALKRLS